MTVSTRLPACSVVPKTNPPSQYHDEERHPVAGLLVTLLAIALVVALLTLAASMMSMNVPGEPVWFDWIIV